MKHDELQEDLARHLRGNTDRMVWTNTQLGPAASPRPDVFTIDKSYARFNADAYEVKISVSDLRRDITSGKWQSYRKFAHRVWFAFPRGLVPLDEIPRECGVILRSDAGWRSARKPVAQVLDTLPRDAWLKLLIESFPVSAVGHRTEPRPANEWFAQDALRRKHGSEIAELFASRKRADRAFEDATERRKCAADEIRAETDEMKKKARLEVERAQVQLDEAMKSLGERLGLAPEDVTAASITKKLNDVRYALENDWHISSAIKQLQRLQGFLYGGKEAA
jgi:hypothetical protein